MKRASTPVVFVEQHAAAGRPVSWDGLKRADPALLLDLVHEMQHERLSPRILDGAVHAHTLRALLDVDWTRAVEVLRRAPYSASLVRSGEGRSRARPLDDGSVLRVRADAADHRPPARPSG